jgi:hypothetical protein
MVPRILPVLKTQTIGVRVRDRVTDLINGIGSGRIKGRQFEAAIEDFTFEELERLSDELIKYYARKFQ